MVYSRFLESLEQSCIAERVALNHTKKGLSTGEFLLFNYSGHLSEFGGFINLGDYVQTYAVETALKFLFPESSSAYFDRDSLFFYKNNNVRIVSIMQGWFAHSLNFFPSSSILPVWCGTHFEPEVARLVLKALSINPAYFQTSVGCRDLSTLEFLMTAGVDAYFSRCLTLTLPKCTDESERELVYFVDVPEKLLRYFPSNLREDAVVVNQRWVNVGCEPWQKSYLRAQRLLKEYSSKAKLVVTSALHCAAPCLAMGIPVVLLSLDPEENKNRFSALDGILSYSTCEDLKRRRVDFDRESVDIEDLKKAMLENLRLTIECAWGNKVQQSELRDIREFIANFRAPGLAK